MPMYINVFITIRYVLFFFENSHVLFLPFKHSTIIRLPVTLHVSVLLHLTGGKKLQKYLKNYDICENVKFGAIS